MPDFHAILTLYHLHAAAAVSGAMTADRDEVAAGALDRVARGFLSRAERDGWGALDDQARAVRLRLGRQRLRRWELANPDISALLKRKARGAAIG
jgi:hypothetical protein